MLKRQLARCLVRLQLPRLLHDSHSLNRLLGRAALLQARRIDDEEFRRDLENFYLRLDVEWCKLEIDLAGKAQRLNCPGGYKTDILGLRCDPSNNPPHGRFDFWARRFGLLRHLGIRSDLLIVRAGDQIPPHAHTQTVSGFYVLEGEVAIRHYDRIREFADYVLLEKKIDTALGPGGFTTNSEYHHNVHWLLGLAPVSYLFRFTVTGVPVRPFSTKRSGTRIYVDPTVQPEASGLIPAPFISDGEAAKVPFHHQAPGSAISSGRHL